MSIQKISKSFRRLNKRVFGQRKKPAMLGRADGEVAAGDGLVYVTLKSGEVVTVRNAKVPLRPFMAVWVGEDDYNPSAMQVLGERMVFGKPLAGSLPLHGDKHQWPGEDTVWVAGNQFVPLLAAPGSTDFAVKLYGATIKWIDGTKFLNVNPPELDLASLVPTTGALYVTLQIDEDGVFSAVAGSEVDAVELLTVADIPLPETGKLELWAVRLYPGQDRLHKDGQVNDFVDLRFGRGASGGGSGGTGDVTGPASAVDGNLAVFDGTTGKVIKDSGIAAADVITDPETVVAAFADYGPELIVNGNFTTDASGWTLGAGWAWESDGSGGGRIRHTAGNTDPLYQSGLLINSAVYKYYALIVGTTGTVDVYADGGDGETYAATATVDAMFQWVDSIPAKIAFYPSSDFDGYIDNVSVTRPPIVPYNPIDGASYVRKNYAWAAFPNADWSAVSGDALILNKPTITNPPSTTAANDVQVGNGSGAWIKKTLAEFVAILRTALDSVYAASAKGVTNGDSHDHSGGDGAQIDYSTLSGLPTLGGAAALNVGTTAGTVAAGNDSRFTDARTPTAHATSHKSGGADAIKLDELAAPTDVTTLNASTSAHGLAPKATAPAAGLLNLLGIGNGETVYSNKAIFDTTNPAALGTAGPGTSLVAARRDHVHAMPSASDVEAVPSDGWIASSATWSYSSLDSAALTGVISVNADMTGLVSVGDRISYVQTSTKHGIITKVGAYSGGATLITFFYGNNTAFANAAITSPKYSHSKTPFGFPTDPTLWTVLVTDTSDRSQSNPTQDQYYNLGSLSITVPIGVWRLGFTTLLSTSKANAQVSMQSALSTSTSSVSDARLLGYAIGYGTTVVRNQVISFRALSIASKTTYYLISRTSTASVTDISLLGASITTVMYAECLLL